MCFLEWKHLNILDLQILERIRPRVLLRQLNALIGGRNPIDNDLNVIISVALSEID
jgi:hypothetical protein